MTDTATTRLPELLSTGELAAYLQVPVSTIAQWRYRGGGPRGIRVGRFVRYSTVDVAAWLDGRSDPVDGRR